MHYCFPPYTVSGMLFTLIPTMILGIKPFDKPISTLVYYYGPAHMVLMFICIYWSCAKIEKNRKILNRKPTITRAERIYRLKIWLLISLLCILIQQSASYYLVYGMVNLQIISNLSTTIFISGLLSIFVAYFLSEYSNFLYHPSDFLDTHFSVFYFIFMLFLDYRGIMSEHFILISYIPFDFYVLKGILVVFLDSSKIMDVKESEDFVIFKTWTGKVYKGRIGGYYLFLIAFLDLEELIEEGVWRKVERRPQHLYLQCQLVSLKLEPQPAMKKIRGNAKNEKFS